MKRDTLPTTRDYHYDVGDSHVVSRALYFALHDERGALLVPPWPGRKSALRFSERALAWRESVEAANARR